MFKWAAFDRAIYHNIRRSGPLNAVEGSFHLEAHRRKRANQLEKRRLTRAERSRRVPRKHAALRSVQIAAQLKRVFGERAISEVFEHPCAYLRARPCECDPPATESTVD